MKATLEFDLDEHFDKLAHQRSVSATDAYLVLFEMDNYLRNKLKYETLPEAAQHAFRAARTELSELMEQHNINLNDLE